jgi:hypothetical protein
VNGTLSTADSYITAIGNDTSSFGNIPGLDTGTNVTKFDFVVSPDAPHLHSATFNLNATASNGGPWPIQVQVPIACMANAGQVDSPVIQSSDDAEEQTVDGTVTVKGSDLELGQDDLGPQLVGLRFQNLIVPKGAVISEAYVEFTAAQTDSGVTSVTFHGQASDDTLPFSSASQNSAAGVGAAALEASAYNISTRPKTAASVPWTAIPTWSVGQSYQSPDLSPVIQEIVDRSGWSPGNSLALIISGTGRRTAFSYDGQPALAPRLHLTFGGELTCYTLDILATPGGGGTVLQQPGANCGADRFLAGTSVQLTAVPVLDHAFSGWTGAHAGSDNPATVVMDADKRITAAFTAETCHTLTTGVNPAGTGSIVASPEPNCGGGKYVAGTSVELTAVPQGAFVFDSWTGPVPPSTDNPLTVVVDADKTATANFASCHSLITTGLPYGTGTVEVTPPPNCADGQYRGGTQVQLTALPAVGYTFTQWAGSTAGTVNPTTISVVGDMVITASFEEGTCRSLSLRVTPTGAGTVTADPPPDCEGTMYNPGVEVELTALPKTGFKLVQWSGAATGSANPTKIIVGVANTATAEFGLENIVSTARLPFLAR